MVLKPSCVYCGGDVGKNGRDRNGKQRYLCRECSRTFVKDYTYRASDPRVKEDIVLSVVRGVGIRETARMHGVSKDTVSKHNKV